MEEKKKLYCGNSNIIPEGYSGRDRRYNCLKKGIGVGLSIAEERRRKQILERRKGGKKGARKGGKKGARKGSRKGAIRRRRVQKLQVCSCEKKS